MSDGDDAATVFGRRSASQKHLQSMKSSKSAHSRPDSRWVGRGRMEGRLGERKATLFGGLKD